jgi:hypothetical protein
LHFSEDPTIKVFVPHVAKTARQPGRYVWAVNAARSPDYWFPRQCPRAMAWATATTAPEDRTKFLGPGGGDRVHAVEYGWLDAIRTVRLYAYRLPAERFTPFGDPVEYAHVSEQTVEPLGPPDAVGDVLELHERAGIQMRVLPNIWSFWDAVVGSSLESSGIRLANATPRLG